MFALDKSVFKKSLLSEMSCMPELKTASLADIQIWTKATTYLQLSINSFTFEKACTNTIRIVQHGNVFEFHSNVLIKPGMDANDVLYVQDNKESTYYRLNLTLNEMYSEAKFAGFEVVQQHALQKEDVQTFLDQLDLNRTTTVKMPISPLILRLTADTRPFFRKQISTNPTGYILEANFELSNQLDQYKCRFNFYSQRDEILKRLVKCGYAVTDDIQKKHPEVFAELRAAAALGLIGRMSEIAGSIGFNIIGTPTFSETSTRLRMNSTRLNSYSVDILDHGIKRTLSTHNGLVSVDMLTSLTTDYQTLQSCAERCNKRALDQLVKESLVDGCSFIGSDQKLFKRIITTSFDSKFTEISFNLINQRSSIESHEEVLIDDHGSERLHVKIKLRDAGSLNISINNDDGSKVETEQADLLIDALNVGAGYIKMLNKEEAGYLISKQLNHQYNLSWLILS